MRALSDLVSATPTSRPRECDHRCVSTSYLSVWSDYSFLSIGWSGSFLSIGSVGSACSIGSVASFGSVCSVASALARCSAFPAAGSGLALGDRARPRLLAGAIITATGAAIALSGARPALRFVERAWGSVRSCLSSAADASSPASAATAGIENEKTDRSRHARRSRADFDRVMELAGLEPATSWVRFRRKPLPPFANLCWFAQP